jgi:hypothetical protein
LIPVQRVVGAVEIEEDLLRLAQVVPVCLAETATNWVDPDRETAGAAS